MTNRENVTARQQALHEFVNSYMGAVCEWGKSDCTTWCADWIAKWTGMPLRFEAFSGKHQAAKIIAKHGNLINLWSHVMAENGFRERYPAQVGDVGIIEGREGPMGAIFLHGGFAAIRTENGVHIIQPSEIHGIWSVP